MMMNKRDDDFSPVTFKRSMGLLSATTLGVGSLMGAGLYVLVGIAAAEAAVPWEELAASDAPLVLVAQRSIGGAGSLLIGVGAILASIEKIGAFATMIAKQSHCSVILVRQEKKLPSFITIPPALGQMGRESE